MMYPSSKNQGAQLLNESTKPEFTCLNLKMETPEYLSKVNKKDTRKFIDITLVSLLYTHRFMGDKNVSRGKTSNN